MAINKFLVTLIGLVIITFVLISIDFSEKKEVGFGPIKTPATTWYKTYDMDWDEILQDVIQTSDRGYIGVGLTRINSTSDFNLYVLKVDSQGNVQWENSYGGDKRDTGKAVIELPSGYLIVGTTESFHDTDELIYLIEIDDNGNFISEHTYAAVHGDNIARSFDALSDGYIVGGYAGYGSSDNVDFMVLKINLDYSVSWVRTYGTPLKEYAQDTAIANNGDIVLGGYVVVNDTHPTVFDYDVIIMRLDQNGNQLWTQTYGTDIYQTASSIVETNDGGFTLAGNVINGTAEFFHLLKTDSQGNMLWDKTYLNSGNDGGNINDHIELSDGSMVLGGRVNTDAGGSGETDPILIKVDWLGNVLWDTLPRSITI